MSKYPNYGDRSSELLFCLLPVLTLCGALLLGSCGGDDEWVDPTGDDDDASDDDDSVPWDELAEPGLYEGESTGTVMFAGSGQYPCEGTVNLELNEDRLATGTIECSFSNSAGNCVLEVLEVEVDGGPEEFEVDCYGPGIGLLQVWSTNADFVGGRWQRTNEAAGVEITWNAERIEGS